MNIPSEFRNKQISIISTHDADCCNRAWSWFQSMHSAHKGNSRDPYPRWLLDEFSWEPSTWPIYWCEAAELDSFDCGVFAAITRALLAEDNLEVVPIQLIEQFNKQNVENWRSRWRKAGANTDWLSKSRSYHEVVGVVKEREYIEIWDPVERRTITPTTTDGYGQITAIRPVKPAGWDGPDTVTCDSIHLTFNNWNITKNDSGNIDTHDLPTPP